MCVCVLFRYNPNPGLLHGYDPNSGLLYESVPNIIIIYFTTMDFTVTNNHNGREYKDSVHKYLDMLFILSFISVILK